MMPPPLFLLVYIIDGAFDRSNSRRSLPFFFFDTVTCKREESERRKRLCVLRDVNNGTLEKKKKYINERKDIVYTQRV